MHHVNGHIIESFPYLYCESFNWQCIITRLEQRGSYGSEGMQKQGDSVCLVYGFKYQKENYHLDVVVVLFLMLNGKW